MNMENNIESGFLHVLEEMKEIQKKEINLLNGLIGFYSLSSNTEQKQCCFILPTRV